MKKLIEINNYLSLLDKIEKDKKLVCLSDNNYIHFETSVGSTPFKISTQEKLNEFDVFKNLRDLNMITKDLKIFISNLYLFQPFINNPTKEHIYIGDTKQITYLQNEYDSQFMTYVSVCYEKIYNFWDRIGDRIWFYFDLKINQKDVYFSRVVNQLETDYKDDENFKWFIDFLKKDYKFLNTNRREIVHYYQQESEYFEDVVRNTDDIEKIRELYNKKLTLPDYFKHQLDNCILGMVKLVKFENSVLSR